jgi:regulatory protein
MFQSKKEYDTLFEMKNELDHIWDMALGMLERRNHTAFELEQKLLHRGFDKKKVRKIISKCSRLHFIDDNITGRLYLSELIRKGYGPHRIRHEMSKKGLGRQLIDELFFEEKVEKNERAMCEKVLVKKNKLVPDSKDPQKRKALLHRFLLSRGFSRAVILDLIAKGHPE